jgi:ATP-dependent Clp protease protease subunit
VLILDCCFSGRAIDDFMADRESLVMGQIGVGGTYTLTSSPANEPSLAPPDAEYTAFTGELLALLRDGVPSGPAELDLQVLFQQLVHRMTERGWPVPKQCGTDNVHNLALALNRRHSRAANRNASDRLLQTLLTGQPAPEMVERLLDNRIILLNTTVDEGQANQITAWLLLLAAADPTSDIHFYINSPGGSVSAAMAIYDTMKLIEPSVATWAVGLASGTAQLLLAAGARGKRSALPHARILMKQPTTAVDTPETLDMLARAREEIAQITATDTGQPLDRIRTDLERTRWFTAFEALEYGLVDQVAARLDAPAE